MKQVTSIRVEISNHPSKMSFTKEHRKHKRAAVNSNLVVTLLLSVLKNLVMSELCSLAWFVKFGPDTIK